MHPIVEVRSPGGTAVLVVVDRRLELGREAPDVVLGDPLASRRHAAIDVAGGVVTVEDLASSNGTLVNGVPISMRTPLRAGDVALIGDTEASASSFDVLPVERSAAEADLLATTPAAPANPNSDMMCLRLNNALLPCVSPHDEQYVARAAAPSGAVER